MTKVRTQTWVQPELRRFVEISSVACQNGMEVEVTTGRLHSAGRTTRRIFPTPEGARRFIAKRVQKCIVEGYREEADIDPTTPPWPTRIEGKLVSHLTRRAFWRAWWNYHLHALFDPAKIERWLGSNADTYWSKVLPNEGELNEMKTDLRVPLLNRWLFSIKAEETDAIYISYALDSPSSPQMYLGGMEGATGDRRMPFLRFEEAEAIIAAAPTDSRCSEAALRLLLLPAMSVPSLPHGLEAFQRRITEHLVDLQVVSSEHAEETARVIVGINTAVVWEKTEHGWLCNHPSSIRRNPVRSERLDELGIIAQFFSDL